MRLKKRLEPKPILHWLKGHRVDFILSLVSVICFVLFVRASVYYRELSGMRGPVGTLIAGKVERKPTGVLNFGTVGPGTEFNNMDAVWTAREGHARIELEDGEILEMEEMTLIILKRPFKRHTKGSILERVKVLRGKVTTTVFKRQELVVIKKVMPEDPDVTKVNETDPTRQNLYPPANAAILKRETGDVEIVFSWPKAATGYHVLRRLDESQLRYTEVENERFVKLLVPQNAAYIWQIVDANKKVLAGPYKFELKVLTDESAKKLFKEGVQGPAEIHW
ncbi:MAG: FecR domain-containing protein [Methylotenera sp.]|nr:FecR domain-containing protein [Oligoflexia bacterium]